MILINKFDLACPICPMLGFNDDSLIDHLINVHQVDPGWAEYLINELRIEARWKKLLYEARN